MAASRQIHKMVLRHLLFLVNTGLLLQSVYDPVFFFELVRSTAGRALQDMHGIEAGSAVLAVYGVDGETGRRGDTGRACRIS